jgi:hypothetical protein
VRLGWRTSRTWGDAWRALKDTQSPAAGRPGQDGGGTPKRAPVILAPSKAVRVRHRREASFASPEGTHRGGKGELPTWPMPLPWNLPASRALSSSRDFPIALADSFERDRKTSY